MWGTRRQEIPTFQVYDNFVQNCHVFKNGTGWVVTRSLPCRIQLYKLFSGSSRVFSFVLVMCDLSFAELHRVLCVCPVKVDVVIFTFCLGVLRLYSELGMRCICTVNHAPKSSPTPHLYDLLQKQALPHYLFDNLTWHTFPVGCLFNSRRAKLLAKPTNAQLRSSKCRYSYSHVWCCKH